MAEAKKHSQRETDVLWPKEYIDARISQQIDMQHCDNETGNTISMDVANSDKGGVNKMTQEQAVETLERNGYTWKYTSDEFGFIVLARKIGAGMIQQVEVDEDGLCNGLLLHDYLKEVTV